MHIVYPVNPEKPVPVMCLSSSTEFMSAAPQNVDRPHMNGFLFRGYAGVVYDHMYTPMVRADAYKYYDGEPREKMNAVSGDRWTYSVHLYNGNKINTAAMRYLRYLALSEPQTYRFDTDAIGLYGNSKGGWMTFLGAKKHRSPLIADPENYADTDALENAVSCAVTAFTERRQSPGHHSESRWDNGITGDYTNDGVTVHGGERQPWLTFNGKEITGGVQFLYASNGGCEEEITDGHAPSFPGKKAAICPKRTESGKTTEIFHMDFKNGIGTCRAGRNADPAPAKAPDTTDALRVILRDNAGTYNGSVFYLNLTTAVTVVNLLGDQPLTMADVGRRFTVQVKICDTVSRTVQLMLNGCTSGKENTLDYRCSIYNYPTEAGAWKTFTFDHEVYEPLFGEIGLQTKTLTLSASPDGDRKSPLYIGEITVTEKL